MENFDDGKGFTSDKIIKGKSGIAFLFLHIIMLLLLITGIIFMAILTVSYDSKVFLIPFFIGVVLLMMSFTFFASFKIVGPNQARVFTLFGKYYGVIKEPGFYFLNPFVASIKEKEKKSENEIRSMEAVNKANSSSNVSAYEYNPCISLKTRTLLNNKQKINDQLGNPIEISIAVTWKIVCPTMALLNVDNYKEYLSIQCDSALRNIVRSYPYDISNEKDSGDEKTLRGSSTEIAEKLKNEIQAVVKNAGIEIIDARITHLAYAPEIAAAMLQRQQASAIVDARQMIVEGAVSMVDMALSKLSAENIVELDDERKARMVSNLLVVLCGNKDAQPIVNSGSLY
ncbi:MAG: hypothetical protein CR988_08045 [Treponema sp.]|nr:MAG: hypothetical protein CR988_08045 [Treponema sp.]